MARSIVSARDQVELLRPWLHEASSVRGGELYVLRDRDREVGQLLVATTSSGRYIADMWTDPAYRGQGIATTLWRQAGCPPTTPGYQTPEGIRWAQKVGAPELHITAADLDDLRRAGIPLRQHTAGTYYHRSVSPIDEDSKGSFAHTHLYTTPSGDPHDAGFRTRSFGDHVYSVDIPDHLVEDDPNHQGSPTNGDRWYRTHPDNLRDHPFTHIYDPTAPFGNPRTAALYDEYAGHHQAPGPGTGFPIHDMTGDDYGGGLGGVPEDWYTHPHYYSSGETSPRETKRVQQLYNQVRGNPEAPVDVYRALPHGNTTFQTGDWVTPSLEYARQHAMQSDDPSQDWPVIKTTTPAKHLWQNGDSYYEFGYHGPKTPGTIT